jgi:O-antigen ligase
VTYASSLLLLLIIFLPNTSLEVYLITITVSAILFARMNLVFNIYVLLMILLYGIYTLLRQYVDEQYNVRDLTEIFRVLSYYLFYCGITKITEKKTVEEALPHLISIISIFVFIISMIETFLPSSTLTNFFINIYMSDGHYERSFLTNSRASGVSTGPGQAGTLGAFLFAVNLLYFFFNDNKRLLLQIFGLLSSVGIVLLAQSQTGLIAISFLFLFALLLFGRKLNVIKLTLVIFIFFIFLYLIILLSQKIDLNYLFSLFEYGLERSSFQKRIDKWAFLLNQSADEPFRWLLGHGKDYFGDESAAVDSDIIFIIIVYGPLISALLFCFVTYVFIKFLFKDSIYHIYVVFSILIGLMMSIPSAFLFDTKVCALFIFIYVLLRKNLEYEKYSNPSTR